jgi:hypothetical protein
MNGRFPLPNLSAVRLFAPTIPIAQGEKPEGQACSLSCLWCQRGAHLLVFLSELPEMKCPSFRFISGCGAGAVAAHSLQPLLAALTNGE